MISRKKFNILISRKIFNILISRNFFKVVGVQRDKPAEEAIEEVDTVDRGGNYDFTEFVF